MIPTKRAVATTPTTVKTPATWPWFPRNLTLCVKAEISKSDWFSYPDVVLSVLTRPVGLATRCVKVTNAPSGSVEVLRTVTIAGAVNETFPLRGLVIGIELGNDNVVSGELVIVVNIVDVLDARTGTTERITLSRLSLFERLNMFYQLQRSKRVS